jgi:hypothetical protein
LTVEQFNALGQESIVEALVDMLGDPDAGLPLREDVKEKLLASLTRNVCSYQAWHLRHPNVQGGRFSDYNGIRNRSG